MKYMRQTSRYTWTEYKTNTEISKELNIIPFVDKIRDYRKKTSLQHINRIPRNSLQ